MRRHTVGLLRSPIGGEALALEIIRSKGEDILEGYLVDATNSTWFRIENGIADLRPPELRALDSYAEVGCHYGSNAISGRALEQSNTDAVNSQKKQIAFFGRYYRQYE